jgi:hypothetical protein
MKLCSDHWLLSILGVMIGGRGLAKAEFTSLSAAISA